MNALPPAFFLMGPTAAGKTDIAVALCQALPCEIISVDSSQVYRGMDIGSSKPDQALLAVAPHRLINIRDPEQTYSAAQFREDALVEMADITASGRIPLLVGGTMLYFKALEKGLSELPSANAETRAALEAEAKERGWGFMHARLSTIDPVAAARIHPNDTQRTQRALEVYAVSGKTLTELRAGRRMTPLPYRLSKIIVAPSERDQLRQCIKARFLSMLDQGLVSEVETLYRRPAVTSDLPSMRAVGYRQVGDYLHGGLSYEDMVERAIIATRQLAKRQLTWLRADCDAAWFDSTEKNITVAALKSLLRNAM
ncbi:MAG: tRNA (adenosine(37)-N6)-dimethylallyltransferase MiaA [Gammaproteobacteria bacterium]|nr:tRNA (adenosine(37)-N6)-dimethylallyltransferase MiaA [Gammaproteobacteria bacterium]